MILEVPLSVLGEFLAPEAQFGFGPSAAARVLVPKTAMDEDDLAEPGKYQIRFARQIFRMQAVSKPDAMYKAANLQFGPCVLAVDARHPLTSLLLCESVHGHLLFTEDS